MWDLGSVTFFYRASVFLSYNTHVAVPAPLTSAGWHGPDSSLLGGRVCSQQALQVGGAPLQGPCSPAPSAVREQISASDTFFPQTGGKPLALGMKSKSHH